MDDFDPLDLFDSGIEFDPSNFKSFPQRKQSHEQLQQQYFKRLDN